MSSRVVKYTALAKARFADAHRLFEALGFTLDRVHGSHHIYRHPDISQSVNLQARGRQAKPYQRRQVLDVIERNALQLREDKK